MASEVTGEIPIFAQVLIPLAAAIIVVPLSKRIGLGSILGYLVAGIIIGPLFTRFTGASDVLHFAEIGVVLLLFIIGLELKPSRLWSMKGEIFGLGALQVLITGIILFIIALAFRDDWRAALIIGFGLALSSTAFVLQVLEEKNELHTKYGQRSFTILLFQDLAVVPILVLIPILAPWMKPEASSSSALIETLKAPISIILLYIAIRYGLNPLFRILAKWGARETLTAAALFIVLGSAMLMDYAGLSMATGAFLAGVLLAESSFRHQLEADIEPFRGLLLGLFFIAVGMSIDMQVVMKEWAIILIAVPILLGIKASILYGLTRLWKSSHEEAIKVALILPQGGEFAFVVFVAASSASGAYLLPSELASMLTAIVTITMALTPFLSYLEPIFIKSKPEDNKDFVEDYTGANGNILIIGFGRFGQIVSQILLAEGAKKVTIIDNDSERIKEAAKFGFRIYYGEGTRLDVLRASGAGSAELICICVDQKERANKIVDLCYQDFPFALIYVRSFDRNHTIYLQEKGVDFEIRETYESAIHFGKAALQGLGLSQEKAQDIINEVRKKDKERLTIQHVSSPEFYKIDSLEDKDRLLHAEPLISPHQGSKALSKETEKAVEQNK